MKLKLKYGTCKNCGKKNVVVDKGVCEECWYELGYHIVDEPRMKPCNECGGKGFLNGDGFTEDTETCWTCGGAGEVNSNKGEIN